MGEINQSSSVANVKRMLAVKLFHKHQLITTWVLRSQPWPSLTSVMATSHQHSDRLPLLQQTAMAQAGWTEALNLKGKPRVSTSHNVQK